MDRTAVPPAPKKDESQKHAAFFTGLLAFGLLIAICALIAQQLVVRRMAGNISDIGDNENNLIARVNTLTAAKATQEDDLAALREEAKTREDDIKTLVGLIRGLSIKLADMPVSEATHTPAEIAANAEYVIRIEAGGIAPKLEGTKYGNGSGSIITYKGAQYILTVHHLRTPFTTISSIIAIFRNELALAPQPLELVGEDPLLDLGVYRFADHAFVFPGKTAEFTETDDLRSGEPVVALGYPGGLLFYASCGAIGNPYECGHEYGHVQPLVITHTAPSNKGNSGGPLVLCRTGKVIGMNTAVLTHDSTGEAYLFPIVGAVPAVDLMKALADIIGGTPPVHATCNCVFLNSTQLTTETDLMPNGLQRDASEGVYTFSVQPGSAAAKAGLTPGDRIVSANGVEFHSHTDLDRMIFFAKPGDTLHVIVERAGKLMAGDIVLDEYTMPEQK